MKITECGDYRTRDGRKVTVLCVDAPGIQPVIGYYVGEKESYAVTFSTDGKYYYLGGHDHQLDIIGPWREPLDFDWDCIPSWAVGILQTGEFDWWWSSTYHRPFNFDSMVKMGSNAEYGLIHRDYHPKNYRGPVYDSWHWKPGCEVKA